VALVVGRRRDFRTLAPLVAAALGSVALLVAATIVKVHRLPVSVGSVDVVNGRQVTTHRTIMRPAATLVTQGGVGVLIVVVLPLIAVLLVAVILWRRRRMGHPTAGRLAWSLSAFLAGLGLLSLLSVGRFVLPIAILLAVACASSSSHTLPTNGST
jgi:hypothetical protein